MFYPKLADLLFVRIFFFALKLELNEVWNM